MKLMEGVLKKLRTAVDTLAVDGVCWDLTSRHPLDEYIDVIALVLIQLLEIRGQDKCGNTFSCAGQDNGACGVVARARTQGRALRLTVATESTDTGGREEVKIVTYYPEDRRKDRLLDWEPGKGTYAE